LTPTAAQHAGNAVATDGLSLFFTHSSPFLSLTANDSLIFNGWLFVVFSRGRFCSSLFYLRNTELTAILKLQGVSKKKNKVKPNTAAYVKDGAMAIVQTLEGLSPFIPVPLVSELMKISIRVLKACDVSVLQLAEGGKHLITSNRTRAPSKMTWGSFTDEFIL
jgi:hypothetical protein